MKNINLLFLLIIFISGCATPSRFVSYDNYGYVSKCGFYSHEQLKKRKLYIRKNTNVKIYFIQDEKYEILQENQYEINTADIIPLPIETCDDTWCKIYYPCGDTEYFVKKDDIEQYKTWGHKKVIASTRGLIADLVESVVDLFGGTSGIAKQTGYEMKNNPNNHYVALSQGSLIANSAINYYGLNENIVYVGTPLYTKPNNGITINSKNDVIHDPTNIFNIPLYKNGQIFYEHIWGNQYKGVIENIKIKEQ